MKEDEFMSETSENKAVKESEGASSVEVQKPAREYKLTSAAGTYWALLGKGRIYNTITMDEEKMSIQTKPAKKSTIPVLYYEDITAVMVNTKITGYALFFVIVSLLCCFVMPGCVVLVAFFIWYGLNRKITISLRSGNQAVVYSNSKKRAQEFVSAVKEAAGIS